MTELGMTELSDIEGSQSLRILRLYHAYRIIVGLVLAVLVSLSVHDQLLDLANGSLFEVGCWVYLIFNTGAALLVRQPDRLAQTFALALSDIAMLATLFYAAGGDPSGIGNLLIVAVAIANFMLRGRIGLVLAAFAASALIYLTFYLSLSRPAAAGQFVQVGALGALCFAAALFVQALSKKLRQSERLAAERAAEVASLEAINAQILERMRTGILVMDVNHQVLQANQSALGLLGKPQLIGRRLDLMNTGLAPGPDRGADIVHRLDALTLEDELHPDIEIRGIDADEEIRWIGDQFTDQLTPHREQALASA